MMSSLVTESLFSVFAEASAPTTYVHSYSFHRSIHSNGSGQMTFAQGLFDGQLRSRFLAIVCKGGNVYGGVQFRALNSSHKKETFPSKTPPDLTSLLAEIYMFCSASLWEIGVEKVETHRLAPLSAIHCGW